MKIHLYKQILIILLLLSLSLSQQCTTKFDLDNILQDQIVIYPNYQNQTITETQQYFYPRTFFTSTPKIITSIQSYQVPSFSIIDYSLVARVSRSFVDFTFTSNNMNWTFVKVKLWLTARADLLVGSFLLQNIAPSSNLTFDIAIPSSFSTFIDEKTLQINFITGLKATTTDDFYEAEVKNFGKSVNNTIFKVNVISGGKTSISRIQISYTIFNFESSYFASGGGQISYSPISRSQYKRVHGSFAPIIYEIQGFDKIKIGKSSGMNLQFVIDADLVLQVYAGNRFEQLGVVYLTIGRQPAAVCSCDEFILKSGCNQTCPAMTYPYSNYVKGGKSCLTCSNKLNQTINQFGTGCTCLDGLTRVGQYCIVDNTIKECTAKNTVLSNGACVCISGTQLVNGNCEATCKSNQVFNNLNQKCQCTLGYFNITGVCGVCPTDKVYSQNFKSCICPQFQFIGPNGTCICIPTYFNYLGKCVNSCPSGFVKSQNTCVVSVNCSINETVQNGKCVCTNGTYLVNKTCTVCPVSTYYNLTSLSCINCISNCEVCFDITSCGKCKTGFLYNQTSNQCVLNKTCAVNQTLVNGMCVCITGTYEVSGVCTVCPTDNFYIPSSKSCQPCVKSCLSCKNSTSCDLCLPNYNFNSTFGYCVPNCGKNQTLSINGSCQCITGTFRIDTVCTVCPLGQFYQLITKNCKPCIANCESCSTLNNCQKCSQNYFFNYTTKICILSNCSINQAIINGRCDCIDGYNRINGVCGKCNADEFYSAVDKFCKKCAQDCKRCANQVMCAQCQQYFKLINGECRFNLYDLKSQNPQFTQNIILTDFQSSELSRMRKLSQQELNSIFLLQFDKSATAPNDIIIKQNEQNLSEIRVMFVYCGYVPLEAFNVTYTFKDPSISNKEDIQIINYDVLKSGLNNFLK